MAIEIIKAGQWVVAEGGIPEYSIYKLRRGRVSVFKSGAKIRELEVTNGDAPIMMGVTAIMRDNLMHKASVRAETDIEVDRIFVDGIRNTLANEISGDMKQTISLMIKSIEVGNEIVSMSIKYRDMPHVDMDIPSNFSPETVEILSEIERLYHSVSEDVNNTLQQPATVS